MNERVKSILAKAHLELMEENGAPLNTTQLADRFAKLLVMECVDVAKKAKSLEAAAGIMLHFGVK